MHVLSEQASIAHHFIAQLRDKQIQQDSLRFRHNLVRLGEIMAYEISRSLPYQDITVETVLGQADVKQLRDEPVLLTVMRAGLPFFEGFQRIFDHATSGFIGAFRSPETSGDNFSIDLNYQAAPSLEEKHVIIADPMLATGQSLVKAIHALSSHGQATHWHIAAAIAAPEGVEYV